MEQLPFAPEEIEYGTCDTSDRWYWAIIIFSVVYFVGRSLVTIIWGI